MDSTEIQTEINLLTHRLRGLRAEAIERRKLIGRRDTQLAVQQSYSRNERNIKAATTRLTKARSALEATLLTITSVEQRIADLQLSLPATAHLAFELVGAGSPCVCELGHNHMTTETPVHAVCGEVRPGTLGYQRCQLHGEHEIHRAQDGGQWTAYAPGVNPRKGDLVEGVLAGKDRHGKPLNRIVRRVLSTDPWPINSHSTTLMDGKGAVAVLSSTVRVVG